MLQNSITLLFVISFIGLLACQSAPIDKFSDVKESMSKAEVLEALGSPTRTEREGSKEKWAYKYYTGDDRNVEELRYVTFVNGKVTSFGDDGDEKKRLKEIKESDEKKQKRHAAKAAAKATEAAIAAKILNPEAASTPEEPQNIEFTEIKGESGPVGNPDAD